MAFLASLAPGEDGRRRRLERAGRALHERGRALLRRLWGGLRALPGVTLYGPPPDAPRTPTASFVVQGRPSAAVAGTLAGRGVFVSHGDFYASSVVKCLGHEADGLVRAGCAAYTTAEEVDRLIELLLSKNQQALRQLKFIINSGVEADLKTAQAFEQLSAGLTGAVNGGCDPCLRFR